MWVAEVAPSPRVCPPVRGLGARGPPLSLPVSADFMNVYYQIRSSQLDRSLRGLKEHFRKNSSSAGVPYSPATSNKRKDTPTKKPVRRPGESYWARVRPEGKRAHVCAGVGRVLLMGHGGLMATRLSPY